MLLLGSRLNLRMKVGRNRHFLFLLSSNVLLPPFFFVLFQDKLYQEKQQEEELKQSDNGPGEKVPNLEEGREDGDKTKELMVRLKDLEVSPTSSWPNQLTCACCGEGLIDE